MAFLLDTNVVSELVKAEPEARVIEWLESRTAADLYLAAQTLGELVRGARKLKDKGRRAILEKWIEQDLEVQFHGRVLPFDGRAAVVWGRLMGDGDRRGRTPALADAQIAAVAIFHDLTLATRNVRDFARFEMRLLNPWDIR